MLDRWIDYDAKHPQEYQLCWAMLTRSHDRRTRSVPNVQIIPGSKPHEPKFHTTAFSTQFGILFQRQNAHVLLDMMEKFYVHYQMFRFVKRLSTFKRKEKWFMNFSSNFIENLRSFIYFPCLWLANSL